MLDPGSESLLAQLYARDVSPDTICDVVEEIAHPLCDPMPVLSLLAARLSVSQQFSRRRLLTAQQKSRIVLPSSASSRNGNGNLTDITPFTNARQRSAALVALGRIACDHGLYRSLFTQPSRPLHDGGHTVSAMEEMSPNALQACLLDVPFIWSALMDPSTRVRCAAVALVANATPVYHKHHHQHQHQHHHISNIRSHTHALAHYTAPAPGSALERVLLYLSEFVLREPTALGISSALHALASFQQRGVVLPCQVYPAVRAVRMCYSVRAE